MFREDYDPTVFDNFMTTVRVGNHGVKLSMWDTPGQGDYDRFRPLAYSSADVFLVCFSIDDPISMDNALTKWIEEIDAHRPNAPKLFIGTKADYRCELSDRLMSKTKNKLIPYGIIENAVSDKGFDYMECSSLTQKNLRQVFERAIQGVLNKRGDTRPRQPKRQKQNCSLI